VASVQTTAKSSIFNQIAFIIASQALHVTTCPWDAAHDCVLGLNYITMSRLVQLCHSSDFVSL
jgi:hypothetical protein